MIYPGYLLNPGDMFQVDPDRVMFATGAPKDAQERRLGRHIRRKAKEAKEPIEEVTENGEVPDGEPSKSTSLPAAASEVSENAKESEDVSTVDSKRKATKATLKDLLAKAKLVLGKDKEGPSAKRKQELRAFVASVRNAIGQINKKSVEALDGTVSNLDDELNTLLSQLSISSTSKPAQTSPPTPSTPNEGQLISKEDRQTLREALREARENPIDPTKPYATPWRPRPYMSAFAFIPRYLEVNQNICSAVYLRHPVARPGLAEVPTPFSPEVNQLAFTWYLRRR